MYSRDNWNHLKIIQEISEQRSGKAQKQGTTENSHIGHYVHSLESTDVKVQNITCTTNCDQRIAATLYALEALFASGI